MSRMRRTRRASDPRREAIDHQLGDRRARHQHPFIDVQLEPCKKSAMRKVGKRHALGDAPLQQRVDARDLARRQLQRIGARAQGVRESGDEEHQLGRFVARAGGAMTEMDARSTQRPRAAQNGRADAFGRSDLGGGVG